MMRNQEDVISVAVRSFIPPQGFLEGYELGRPFKMELRRGTTLGELTKNILGENMNQLGISAVNGQIARENSVLAEADKIDFFALIEGG